MTYFIWRRTGGASRPWLAIESTATEAEARELLALCRAAGDYVVSATRPGASAKIDKRVAEKPFRDGSAKLRSDAPDASAHRVSGRK